MTVYRLRGDCFVKPATTAKGLRRGVVRHRHHATKTKSVRLAPGKIQKSDGLIVESVVTWLFHNVSLTRFS